MYICPKYWFGYLLLSWLRWYSSYLYIYIYIYIYTIYIRELINLKPVRLCVATSTKKKFCLEISLYLPLPLDNLPLDNGCLSSEYKFHLTKLYFFNIIYLWMKGIQNIFNISYELTIIPWLLLQSVWK